jgi:hypothetical protein
VGRKINVAPSNCAGEPKRSPGNNPPCHPKKPGGRSTNCGQIELDMQNKELRRAKLELEASRKRYFDLYELAPVGLSGP